MDIDPLFSSLTPQTSATKKKNKQTNTKNRLKMKILK
jgi:hypothetical protein